MSVYEETIKIVEGKEVTGESDMIIQELAEEMEQSDMEYRAILKAAELFVENPATDDTVLGRIKRMSNVFSQEELDEKISLLIDVIFTKGTISA